MTLTTQQAADLLGVSRPTVVRLIKSGELAAERIGNRHRLVLDDVLSYGGPADSASTTRLQRPRWTSMRTRIPA
ncbi:MAG TPA: helix-turn-helix domain-containing protein [Mycobacterium sp.]|nr:helix-turn-helix domain-containing protein [Mycobacterium sp.]